MRGPPVAACFRRWGRQSAQVRRRTVLSPQLLLWLAAMAWFAAPSRKPTSRPELRHETRHETACAGPCRSTGPFGRGGIGRMHPPANSEAMQAELLSGLNAVRREHGLPALKLNAKLDTAAQKHACDNARRLSISHVSSDGSHLQTGCGGRAIAMPQRPKTPAGGLFPAPARLIGGCIRRTTRTTS